MKRLMFAIAALVPGCMLDNTDANSDDLTSKGGMDQGEPQAAGVQWAKGEARSGGGASSDPRLVYHGGTIAGTGFVVQPIFWGASWSNPGFVGDKVTGLQSFYAGLGGSKYDGTNGEYTDSSGSHVGSGITLGVTHTDLSSAPKNGSRTTPILNEVCRQISNPVPNGYYPVYVDTKRGHAGFCAWHSTGTCNGVQVQFAFFFNLDGDPGCDPGTTGGHSQGLSALANVSGHEISEALTDPHLDAWYDSSGAENADKCAWTFGANLLTFSNNTQWRVQGNWSNAAYDAGQGYGGNVGCIDGTN